MRSDAPDADGQLLADDVHRPNRLSAGTIYRLRRTDIDRLS